MKPVPFLTRHRNLLLVALLAVTLAVSSEASRRRLAEESLAVSLPVMQTVETGSVAAYAAGAAESYLSDVEALQSVSADASLDARTREAAAQRLTQLVADRQAADALQTALQHSSLAPCAAVVTGSTVTLVTQNATFSDSDAALLLTLAAAHAGAKPSQVRIVTAPE